MLNTLTRRAALKAGVAGLTMAYASRFALGAEPIVIGVPAAQSGPVGIADHKDWLNGVSLAMGEINAAGGINGRLLEAKVVDIDILTPEGTLAAFQKLTEAKVAAIASPFVLIPQPAMDAAAATGVPYLHGNTSIASLDLVKSNPKKYHNVFQLDVAETWYGTGLIRFITELKASGKWVPKNNKVHIVQEQIAYTQVISKATQAAIAASGGAWEIGAITDIQFPVQDWTPVISALKETDAGVIMIDHWVAAELASFAQSYVGDPVPGALVYLQYGPSQPEFLNLAGEAAEGFVWGTVYGCYADKQGSAFRAAYQAKFPGTMGYVYTGGGYDTIKILAEVWKTVDPADYSATGAAIKAINYRGVNGAYSFNNATQSGTSYPNMVSDPEKGQAHLIMQVQGGVHKIIAPAPYIETEFRKAPWM